MGTDLDEVGMLSFVTAQTARPLGDETEEMPIRTDFPSWRRAETDDG